MQVNTWLRSLAIIVCLAVIAAKDYYEILGVKKDASEKEIKRKFRQLGWKNKKAHIS